MLFNPQESVENRVWWSWVNGFLRLFLRLYNGFRSIQSMNAEKVCHGCHGAVGQAPCGIRHTFADLGCPVDFNDAALSFSQTVHLGKLHRSTISVLNQESHKVLMVQFQFHLVAPRWFIWHATRRAAGRRKVRWQDMVVDVHGSQTKGKKQILTTRKGQGRVFLVLPGCIFRLLGPTFTFKIFLGCAEADTWPFGFNSRRRQILRIERTGGRGTASMPPWHSWVTGDKWPVQVGSNVIWIYPTCKESRLPKSIYPFSLRSLKL